MPDLLYWVIPDSLAGMPMPFVHPERRLNGGGKLNDYPDELRALNDAGIKAIVSLLNIPSDEQVYRDAGFEFLCLPILDGQAPTRDQAESFVRFVASNIQRGRAVAVHCEAGLGRTGTLLAAYLISIGEDAKSAIAKLRAVESCAVETPHQIRFLEEFAQTRPSGL